MCLVQMIFLKLNSIKHTLQYFTLSAILPYMLVLTKKTDVYIYIYIYIYKCVIKKIKKEYIQARSWGNTIALVIWLMKINWFHVLGFTATAYYLWKVLGASISKCIVTAEVTLNGQADLVAVCLHLTTYLQMPRKKMKKWERESERKVILCVQPMGKKRS